MPDAPSSITITSASSTSIEIQWPEPSTGGSLITHYYIYIATGQGSTSYAAAIDNGTSRQYTLSAGIQAGEYYNFKVSAENIVGEGLQSSSVEALAASAPDAPINLTLISQSPTSVSFSWSPGASTNGAELEQYDVWWDANSNGGSFS